LTGRIQVVKCDGSVSSTAEINTSIIQGSGIGPMLYFVMESDLCILSAINVLAKYSDDTNLLVPSDSDLDLSTEFDNGKQWAMENSMVVNILKTKEVVFRWRPNPRLDVCPVALVGVKQVVSAKLLGIVLSQTLRFDIRVNGILKLCSQRIYLLKLLRDKGLLCHLLNTVFDAVVLSKLRYAISVYHGFLSAELKGQINAFLKRA